MIWRRVTLFGWIAFLAILVWGDISQAQQPASVWLLRPASRKEEQSANVKRVPEATCPTPKNAKDPVSNFQPGTSVEIEWSDSAQSAAANPKVELLTTTSDLLTKLESPPSAKVTFNAIKRSASKVFNIPHNLECKECVLRLTLELGDGTSQMVSCADVQVGVDPVSQNSSFLQQSLETLVDCTTNQECSHGECVQGFCYCSTGYYGRNCLNESQSSISHLQTSKYNIHKFPSNNQFLWRIDPLQNAMEMAVRVPIDSSKSIQWLVLGMQPQDSQAKCQQLATVNQFIGISSKAQGVVNKESENSLNELPMAAESPVPAQPSGLNIRKINSSTLSPPKSSADCAANELFTDCPEHSRLCEPSCDWTAFPESIPSCPKACGSPRCVCAEGFVRLSNELNECKPFSFCQAAEVVKECPANQTFAKCGTSCEPTCDNMYNTEPCDAACFSPGCTCVDNHVRNKEGQCIYWGNCPHLEERFLFTTGNVPPKLIGDAKSSSVTASLTKTVEPEKATANSSPTKSLPSTKTTSIPPSSTFTTATASSIQCPVNETVNECGKVCEADCVTIFVREECNECEPPTCACKQGFARSNGACVYWGDCPASPGIETTSSKRNKTYSFNFISTTQAATDLATATNTQDLQIKDNELRKPSTTPKPKTSKDEWCHGQWSWPTDCKNSSDCDYKISWTFAPETDTIDFFLESKVPPNWWTGVGFSSTGSMHDVDMVVVKSMNGGMLSLHDMHVEEYDSLKEDEKNNIYSEKKIGTHTQGVLRASFSRKRYTGDDFSDYTFNDEKCYKFLFPVSGGQLTENGTISNPLALPHVSSEEICIKACPKQLVRKPEYSCQTEFHYPESCSHDNCDYSAKWKYNAQAKDVWFEISSKGIGRWTGIGFSRDGNMTSSDIYTGWVYDGKPYLTDRFAYGRQLPAIEPADKQNIYNMSGRSSDDVQTISFNRKIVTTDTSTDFPLDKCYHYLFPIGGGRVLARKSQDFKNAKTPIGYHDQNHPISSKTKICICDSNGVAIGEASTTPARDRRQAMLESKRQVRASADPFDDKVMPGDLNEFMPKGDPFACSDVAIIEILNHQKLVRVADGFSLNKSAIKADEAFGGSFSMSDVSTTYSAEEGDKSTITVLIKRPLNGNEIADLSFGNGPNTIFLARGHGPVDLDTVEQAEFTDINFNEIQKTLMAQISATATKPTSPSTSTQSTSTSSSPTTTTTMSTTTIPITVASSTVMFIPELETEYPFTVNPEVKMNPEATPPTPSRSMTIATDENCVGSFAYPENCGTVDQNMCTYSVSWRVGTANTVDFVLTARLGPESWTGVGFSPDGSMVNTDAVIISLLKDSSITIMDEFSARYGRPRIDKAQDVFNVASSLQDGQLSANFSRSMSTGDNDDDVDLAECHYFIFLQSGGSLEGGTAEIKKHIETPISSTSKVCLGKCGKVSTTETSYSPSTTTSQMPTIPTKMPKKIEIEDKKPKDQNMLFSGENDLQIAPTPSPSNNHVYDVVIRLLNEKWHVDFENNKSERYTNLSKKLKTILTPLISAKWSTLKDIRIAKFAEGSVLALLQMEFDGEGKAPTAEMLNEFLKEIANQGQAGDLNIDKEAMKVQENKQIDLEDKWGPLKDVRNWLIVGFSLLFLAAIVILLLLCTCRSRRRTHPKSMSFSPHQAYQYASYPGATNVAFDTLKGTDITKTCSTLSKKPNRQTDSSNSSGSPKQPSNAGGKANCPKGIGETTYQEWFAKVASKETPSHFQESTYQTPPARRSAAMGVQSGYVTYPNDPTAYYTLNGEHRLNADQRLPPPSYYRHY